MPSRKICPDCKVLVPQGKGGEKTLSQVFMIYHNIQLTGSLQMPMQILQGRTARSDLPVSNAARYKLGLQSEVLRNIDKHEKLPTHYLHVGQHVMY